MNGGVDLIVDLSGSGQLRGHAKVVDCRQLDRRTLMKHQCFHQLPNAKMVKYKNIWAWILKDAEPYEMPFDYSHKQGAVIFVTVRKRMGPQCFGAEVEPANSPALQGTCHGGKGCEGPECLEFVLSAVAHNGRALLLANPELTRNREIVLSAVAENGFALEFASPELQGKGAGEAWAMPEETPSPSHEGNKCCETNMPARSGGDAVESMRLPY